jgi:DNA-binding response OmpR family regulator
MKKILIVEDDTDIVGILALRLRGAGFEVFTALDGLNGVKLAVEHKPDLILMDIWMPVGIGFSVAERLKALDLGAIPIVYMTASKSRTLKKRAKQLGGAGFIEKPYTFEQVLEVITQVLSIATNSQKAA